MNHRLLERQAERCPDALAVSAPGRPGLTTVGCSSRVDEVNADLSGLGVGRDDRVAIVLPNGPEMAVAFLAVASGATAAPLNPTYRAEEFGFYLSDLGAKVLIVPRGTDSPAVVAAETLGIPIIELSAIVGSRGGGVHPRGSAGRRASSRGRIRGARRDRPRASYLRDHIAAQGRAADPGESLCVGGPRASRRSTSQPPIAA